MDQQSNEISNGSQNAKQIVWIISRVPRNSIASMVHLNFINLDGNYETQQSSIAWPLLIIFIPPQWKLLSGTEWLLYFAKLLQNLSVG